MRSALVVGADGPKLKGCGNDALLMAELLTRRFSFEEKDIRLLSGTRARRDEILARLGWLANRSSGSDELLFYFSGEGAMAAGRDRGGKVDSHYEGLCAADFTWERENSIRPSDLLEWLGGVDPAAHVTVIVDACYSGGMAADRLEKRTAPPPDMAWRIKTAKSLGMKIDRIPSSVAKLKRAVLIAACSPDEAASEIKVDEHAHGAFTYFFVQTIRHASQNISPEAAARDAGELMFKAKPQVLQTPKSYGEKSAKERPLFGGARRASVTS